MVDALWVDPNSKANLALMQRSNAFTRSTAQSEDDDGADTITTLEGLKGKAEESLQKQRDDEAKASMEHTQDIFRLKQAIALAEDKLTDVKKEVGGLQQEKAEAEQELVGMKESKAEDEKSLKAIQHECQDEAMAMD